MLRRGEVADSEQFPLINDMLTLGIRNWIDLNISLSLAAGFQCSGDWHAADVLFAEIRHYPPDDEITNVVAWWRALADRGDSGGAPRPGGNERVRVTHPERVKVTHLVL